MHDQEVVDQGDIAGLPGEIEAQLVGQLDGHLHAARRDRAVVAEADRFGRFVARVLPAAESGDELIEEHAAAVGQCAHGRQSRRRCAQAAVGEPLMLVAERRQPRLGGLPGVRAQRAAPAPALAGLGIVVAGHRVRIAHAALRTGRDERRVHGLEPLKEHVRAADRRFAACLRRPRAAEEQPRREQRRLRHLVVQVDRDLRRRLVRREHEIGLVHAHGVRQRLLVGEAVESEGPNEGVEVLGVSDRKAPVQDRAMRREGFEFGVAGGVYPRLDLGHAVAAAGEAAHQREDLGVGLLAGHGDVFDTDVVHVVTHTVAHTVLIPLLQKPLQSGPSRAGERRSRLANRKSDKKRRKPARKRRPDR